MKSFKQLRESELAKQVLASAKKVSPTAHIDTRSPAERKADTDKMLAARAAAKPKVTNQPSKPSTPEQQMKNQNASIAASYAKHKSGQYVGDSVELDGESINEDHYERAEDSKTLANKAKNEGDEIGFNSHMADHHDHLSQWHEEKGRASAAQSHADKSEMYASKMTQVAKGVMEGSGPKEKQKTPYRDINSPEYRAAVDKQKQRMAKDKATEPGKKMLAKQGVAEGSLEEVSQQTLQSYRKKASAQKRAADDVVSGDADDETWKKNVSLSAKRRQGIDAANKRLGVAEASSAGARMQKALQKAKEDRERSERNAERLLNPVKKPVQPEPVKEENLEEGSFKYHMDKAIAAHEKGDDKKKAYHLENARTAKFAMKTADYAKNRELLDKHKQMSEEVVAEAAQGHTIEAQGIRGMKATPWRKTFKNHEHLEKWADANDSVEVHGTRDLEKAKKAVDEEIVSEEKPGLYANIHAKRKRIAAGSGERMRKPGSKGAPTAKSFRDAQKTVKENIDDGVNEGIARLISKSIKNVTATKKTPQEKADIRLNNLNK
jgi:hypothetical protein